MTISTASEIILDRYREKCRMAGGPRAGFVLRRNAVLYVQEQYPDLNLSAGIEQLEAKGILTPSESGEFLFLTAAGVDMLNTASGDPD